jgi:hypothetical protein
MKGLDQLNGPDDHEGFDINVGGARRNAELMRRIAVKAILGVLLFAVVMSVNAVIFESIYHYALGIPQDVWNLGKALGVVATLVYWLSPPRD